MKTASLFLLACLAATPVVAENDVSPTVKVGDDYEKVVSVLGQPESFLKMEPSILLKYDRGTVKLSNNKVVAVDLVSEEAAQIRHEQERMQFEQRQQMLAEQRSRRIAEGTALKQARMSDPVFLALPPDRQMAFWQQFHVSYPEVTCAIEYQDALSRHEAEMQQQWVIQRQDERIRDLEDRLQRAESRHDTFNRYHYIGYRTIYVPSPICVTAPVMPVKCAQPVKLTTPTRLTRAPYASVGCAPGITLAARMSY